MCLRIICTSLRLALITRPCVRNPWGMHVEHTIDIIHMCVPDSCGTMLRGKTFGCKTDGLSWLIGLCRTATCTCAAKENRQDGEAEKRTEVTSRCNLALRSVWQFDVDNSKPARRARRCRPLASFPPGFAVG